MGRKTEKALADWLNEREWTVFGTLKFTDGTTIHRARADELVSRFWHGLDRRYFGRLVLDKGARIVRATTLQLGEHHANRHYHFVASPPFPADFCEIAKREWGGLDKWCDGERSWITLTRSSKHAASYTVREARFDSWRDEASFQPQLSHMNQNGLDETRLTEVAHRRLSSALSV